MKGKRRGLAQDWDTHRVSKKRYNFFAIIFSQWLSPPAVSMELFADVANECVALYLLMTCKYRDRNTILLKLVTIGVIYLYCNHCGFILLWKIVCHTINAVNLKQCQENKKLLSAWYTWCLSFVHHSFVFKAYGFDYRSVQINVCAA